MFERPRPEKAGWVREAPAGAGRVGFETPRPEKAGFDSAGLEAVGLDGVGLRAWG